MRFLLGGNRSQILSRVFRLSGGAGYEGSTGPLRARLNAFLWRSFYKPAPR